MGNRIGIHLVLHLRHLARAADQGAINATDDDRRASDDSAHTSGICIFTESSGGTYSQTGRLWPDAALLSAPFLAVYERDCVPRSNCCRARGATRLNMFSASACWLGRGRICSGMYVGFA